MIEKYTPQELLVSDAAVSRIDKLVSDEVNKELSLRVFPFTEELTVDSSRLFCL